MRVLIVEDEVRLADALAQIMREHKYEAEAVHDGADGLFYAMSNLYDVVILDVMLPKMSGFEVVQELRRRKNSTPVLMLTAKDGIDDKVKGLNLGADDYLTKPFATEELIARVAALSRRRSDLIAETLTRGDLTMDLNVHSLSCGEKQVQLSHKEFEVMRLLMSTHGVVPKEMIIGKVWGLDSAAEDNNLEVFISFLRRKLSYLGSASAITNLRRVGYRLEILDETN